MDAEDLITEKMVYPDSFSQMDNLSPGAFFELAEAILESDSTAILYEQYALPEYMGPFSKCNSSCRKDLYCKLTESTQQGVLRCRGGNIWDQEYGLNFFLSAISNPWVTQYLASDEEGEFTYGGCEGNCDVEEESESTPSECAEECEDTNDEFLSNTGYGCEVYQDDYAGTDYCP